jgi:cation:H+ antiporter
MLAGGPMFLWSGFILCSAIIVYCGYNLSRYGDIIAEKTGMGRTWIGIALMATVTSLPELITGISSVMITGVPDIAVGDVLGSCVFNMLILAILDALYRPMPINTKAHHGHVLSAGFGILLLSIVAGSLLTGSRLAPFGWIGLYSLVITVVYIIGMRLVFNYERRQVSAYLKEKIETLKYDAVPLKSALTKYALNALAVVGAAVFLPRIGSAIAEQTGLSQSFVGTVFIAITTSLPEVVVCLAALKIDAVDLAIGNLFGSNIFNVFILALDDLLFMRGPLLSFADKAHAVSALSAISMTTIAVISLTYRAEKKILPLAWDSIGIVIIYIANVMLLYMLR